MMRFLKSVLSAILNKNYRHSYTDELIGSNAKAEMENEVIYSAYKR
jgi:hypothetical protein